MTVKLKDIGKRIRQVRVEKKLSQVDLGKVLGISGAAVSKYETGDSDGGAINLARIAEIGSVSLDWLISGNGWCSFEAGGEIKEPITGYKVDKLPEIWLEIIVVVEEYLEEEKLTLSPQKRADLIAILYELFSEGEEIDSDTVARFVRLASVPNN